VPCQFFLPSKGRISFWISTRSVSLPGWNMSAWIWWALSCVCSVLFKFLQPLLTSPITCFCALFYDAFSVTRLYSRGAHNTAHEPHAAGSRHSCERFSSLHKYKHFFPLCLKSSIFNFVFTLFSRVATLKRHLQEEWNKTRFLPTVASWSWSSWPPLLYNVDNTVKRQWLWIDEDKHPCLKRD
jgi:hypothetical protein